jgi:periplasmic glucans biosynthesis protein
MEMPLRPFQLPLSIRFAAHVPAQFGRAAATFVVVLLAAMPWVSAQPLAAVESPTFTVVAERARALAAQPYVAPAGKLPADLAALNYDRHRDIRFRPERALWRAAGLPFEVQFFHPGWLFADPVRVHEVTGEGTREISVDPRDFDYGKNTLDPAAWPKLGFAGFRVHYPLNNAAYKDELVVFLGASYFRALGKGQRYGLSARALAIDTVARPGKPTRGEEFPRFVEFWLERPASAEATSLTLHALLDSPRAAGAYTFTITPGEDTVMQVRSRLYLRAGSEDIATLGIAPLTSMFLHGENQPDDDDFRPEVHDSDGLAVHAGSGEWLWRPLVNPHLSRAKGVLTTSFSTTDPRGFGLMQRDRAFSSYEDLEARYELRPSAWVEPIGAWGAGRVELVQLPTDEEIHDNIVAYWLPEKLPAPGEPLDLAYRVRWQMKQEQRPGSAWVTQTRRGRSYGKLLDGEHKFVIDFDGPALRALPPDAVVEPVVTVGADTVVREAVAYRHDVTGGWRLTLRVLRPATSSSAAQPLELRAFLRQRIDAVAATDRVPAPAQPAAQTVAAPAEPRARPH